jgi:dephospho-CoA kinase
MIIGVTGKYCAGKNVVSCILQKYGFTEIDVDKIGHQVLEKEKTPVIHALGRGILDTRGRINRRKLAKLVFRNKENRVKLEQILHPRMKAEVHRRIKKNNKNYIVNAALLFQMQLYPLCDFIIFVRAPFYVRFLRALRRDKLRIWDITLRFFSQYQIFSKLKLPRVDIYYEYNKGRIRRLEIRIAEILKQRNKEEG